MKSSINTILLVIIIILLGYLIWSITKNNSISSDPLSEQDIQHGITILREKNITGPIQKCIYKGQTVLQIDTRPVDGPVTVYDLSGTIVGSAGSGFGGPANPTIDFSLVKNCKSI